MDLLQRAASRRATVLAGLDATRQSHLGQFFTPAGVAKIMAGLPRLPETGVLRILDPGAGSGTLSAAIVERVRRDRPDVDIQLTAVEKDASLLPVLAQTLADCDAVGARTTLVGGDFVDWALHTDEHFDLVIQNPPYRKIRSGSTLDHDLRSIGATVPNIYAGFMALGSLLLDEHGQQVSITPRSWMNGTYFARFRRALLDTVGIDAIHTFDSRSEVFGDMGVLQETIIVSATRGPQSEAVRLFSSADHRDAPLVRNVPSAHVVTDDFVFVPASTKDAEALTWMGCAEHTLASLGLTASTGRVVDFRSREHLRQIVGGGAAPMVYPANIVGGHVVHPRSGVKKPQWFQAGPTISAKLLIPAGTYVLVKRFSTKEERRRLVSALWRDERPPAFDNKLNYIHQQGHGLDPDIASGLVTWLNSKQVDDYFRVFSGHTQVNASDLRQMKFPTPDQLRRLGRSTLDPDEAVEEIMRTERANAA